MRILLVSDGPQHHTGYSIQAERLARDMAADGHRVFIYSPGGFHEGKFEYADKITVFGSSFADDRWGNQSLPFYIDTLKPDLVLTWLDCQGLDGYGWCPQPTFMWAPIDTWPIPEQERAILNRAAHVFSPSLWGQDVLAKHEIESTYIPCGVDFDVYDIDEEAGKRWRSHLKPAVSEDTFLIGMVGLNTGAPDRKGYGFAFDAIKAFTDEHPDTIVYIHTNPEGGLGAINLHVLRDELGLNKVICFPPPFGPLGATPAYMRGMYNAFDVFLHTALTEGFGVPVVEAQACGTPVVANACTSVTELVTKGYKAKPVADFICNTSTRIALPDVNAIHHKLNDAYYDWTQKHWKREEIRASVARYSFDGWYEKYWKPVIDSVPEPINYERDSGPRKLLLAAGATQKDGYTHHDREKLWPHIDVAHDLNIFPWPFEDDSYDYIEFSDCLEHLKASLPDVMDELHRILADDGYLYIHTARIGTWQLYKDPTHLQGFDLEAMDYFDPETQWGQSYSYSNRKWKVVKKTTDGGGGLIFVMQPRKVAVPA